MPPTHDAPLIGIISHKTGGILLKLVVQPSFMIPNRQNGDRVTEFCSNESISLFMFILTSHNLDVIQFYQIRKLALFYGQHLFVIINKY